MSPPAPSALAVDASGIARRFGVTWVLRGIDLQLSASEVVGLLGANGTGKSTFLRIVGTLLRPHAGTVRVCGHDVVKDADSVRELVAYMAHRSEEHTSELQSHVNLVCRLLLEKKKNPHNNRPCGAPPGSAAANAGVCCDRPSAPALFPRAPALPLQLPRSSRHRRRLARAASVP